jgi:hypothetical protein
MIILNIMRIKATISITMHSKQQQQGKQQLILTTISSIMQLMVSILLSSNQLKEVKESKEQSPHQLIMVAGSKQSLISEKFK